MDKSGKIVCQTQEHSASPRASELFFSLPYAVVVVPVYTGMDLLSLQV